MMTRDQIQTVLDALEYIKLHVPFSDEDGTMYSESAIAILTAALAEPEGEPSTVLRLIDTIKYLVGIAERGEGRKARDDELPEQFVLGYVKRLEAALAEPSEPVAVLDVSMQEHDRGQSLAPASPALKFARTVALPIAKDLPLGVYQLFTHPASKPAQLPELTDGEVVNILCADGCERIESFYHVGPVQKAAVWSFARAILAAARRVK